MKAQIVRLAEEHKHVRQLPKPLASPVAPKVKASTASNLRTRVMTRRAERKTARATRRAGRTATRAARSARMAAAGPVSRQFLRAGGAARLAWGGVRLAAKTSVALGAAEGAYQIGRAAYHGGKAVKAHGHLQRTRKAAKEKYGVTTTQKTLLGSKLLHGLVTGDPGLKVKYERRKKK